MQPQANYLPSLFASVTSTSQLHLSLAHVVYLTFASVVCICRLHLTCTSTIHIYHLQLSFVPVVCICHLHMSFVSVMCICHLHLLSCVSVICICRCVCHLHLSGIRAGKQVDLKLKSTNPALMGEE